MASTVLMRPVAGEAEAEAPLTAFSIGVWRKAGSKRLALLILHSKRQFIFLIDVLPRWPSKARLRSKLLHCRTAFVSFAHAGRKLGLDFTSSMQRGGALRNVQQRIARHVHSPFSSRRAATASDDGSLAPRRYVVAFEVDWDRIVGVDYVNTLCTDGRMVLEAHHVIKRIFLTVCLRMH